MLDALDIVDPIGRRQRTTVINESGLYSLILTSRKEQAKRFKKWVTSAGSGTTGQAAYEEGFDAVLCEREEEYVADIVERLSRIPT